MLTQKLGSLGIYKVNAQPFSFKSRGSGRVAQCNSFRGYPTAGSNPVSSTNFLLLNSNNERIRNIVRLEKR